MISEGQAVWVVSFSIKAMQQIRLTLPNGEGPSFGWLQLTASLVPYQHPVI